MSDVESNAEEEPVYKYVPCRKPKSEESKNYAFVMLAIVGAAAVGKSSILTRFAERTFTGERATTIGFDFLSANIMSNARGGYNRKTSVTLVDTAGQERFMSITPSKIREARGVFLVFDSTERKSFETLERWAEVVTSANEFCCRMLVANKMDLYKKQPESEQWMNQYDWNAEAQRLGCNDGFFCVSALEGENIDSMIVEMVDAALSLEDQLMQEAVDAKIEISMPSPHSKLDLNKRTQRSKDCKC